MKLWIRIVALAVALTTATADAAKLPGAANEFRQLTEATPLPKALDPAFEFRKTKLFFLGDAPGPRRGGGLTGGAVRDPSIGFEGAYRLHGAVTGLDQRRRFGHYFDFFWRAKRSANVTVRLEYRQQTLRSFTQAREVSYANVRGNTKTSFAVIGDDFFADGRITAWRCLLVENGRIVAEERSFLWR
ncbi:MAG TPA: hypothetical protein VK993_04680 [Chthoniobacterales bacterium]|nr:hypothetical protein [Chthoniobacterales bacterium]